MIIYQESKAGFLQDVNNNALSNRLREEFQKKTGSIPSDQRVWGDEYSRFAHALRESNVDDYIQVAIEYHISPGRLRVDVLLAGNDGQTDNGMIIELKAWDKAELTDIEGMVVTPLKGQPIKDHPCLQAKKYKGRIMNFNEDVVRRGIRLHPSAYLFNLHRRHPEPLEDYRYQDILNSSRLFLADDAEELREFIRKVVPHKPKEDVLYIVDKGRLRPTDELVSRINDMLAGNEAFDLIDEQNEAFKIIRHNVLYNSKNTGRQVFIIEGGPGTGKSVIAVQLLGELLKNKKMVFFVAPNKAFRDTLIENLARRNKNYRDDGQALFQSSWSFHDNDFDKDQKNEVLIVDEAHRLKDKAYQYKGQSMVEDMVRASKISIFFIDETQRVSWNDSGSVEAIKKAAQKYNATIHEPFALMAQYRCNGSTGYLNWLDDALGIRKTANFDNWGDGQYDFRVFDKAEELYEELKKKNFTNKARLIAGYSWEWPKKGRNRHEGVKHVHADNLSLPWNYDGETWATSKDGITQVGCIHTSQGLEFDWLGVLIGLDLQFKDGQVIGVPEKRAKTDASLNGWKKELMEAKNDPVAREAILRKVDEIIKCTYKVLMTRGRKGCFVWCADPVLREYLKERVAQVSRNMQPEEIEPDNIIPFVNSLPLLGLRAVANASYETLDGYFGDDSQYEFVKVEDEIITKDRFLVRADGDSMEPDINHGDLCLFRRDTGGSRNGKTVLVRLDGYAGDKPVALIKKYKSYREEAEDGIGEAQIIMLSSINKMHQDIVLTRDRGFSIMGVFEKVLRRPIIS